MDFFPIIIVPQQYFLGASIKFCLVIESRVSWHLVNSFLWCYPYYAVVNCTHMMITTMFTVMKMIIVISIMIIFKKKIW